MSTKKSVSWKVLVVAALGLMPVLVRGIASQPIGTQASFPADSVVLGPLRKLVDMTPGAGVVIGLIDHDGTTRVITHGVAGAPGVVLDGRTVFEVGSITKLFTANVLASMAASRDVALDDPVSRYLPSDVRPRPFDGREITLLDLAMHVSGLPRVPSNLAPNDSSNPYAGYTERRLFSYLTSYSPSRAPASAYEYSNLGYGLLGVALAARAGASYDSVVRSRLLGPLGMEETRIVLDGSLGRRLARGHRPDGRPQPNWELGSLVGAGAYRSTLRDLLIYARANLASDGRLHDILAVTRQRRSVPTLPGVTLGMGWQHGSPLGDLPGVVWKDGETGGYAAFIGLDEETKRAVVILANVAGAEALDAVGLGLLRPSATSTSPAAQAVPESVLASYVGEYALSAAFHMKVAVAGSALSIQGTGQGRLALVPVARDTFDVAGVAARVTFTRDAGGGVVSLTLIQNGSSRVAPRVP
jgi:CubicO group peptidase (beta-lactamase class C family)